MATRLYIRSGSLLLRAGAALGYVEAGEPGPGDPPGQPTVLAASGITETAMNLTWAVPEGSPTSYIVYVGGVPTEFPSTNAATLTGLDAWTVYSIYVTAVNEHGESAPSDPITPRTADTTDPTPATITFTGKTDTTISFTVTRGTDAGSGLDEYDVYVDALLEGSDTAGTYTVIGLTPETEYVIHLIEKDVAGNESAASNTITQTTEAASGLTPPAAPTGLAPVVVASEGFEMSWTASVAGTYPVQHYQIYVGVDLVVRTNDLSAFVQDLTPSTLYNTVFVRAVDTEGNLSDASVLMSPVTTNSGMTVVSSTTYMSVGGTFVDIIYEDQVTVANSDQHVFKFCKFEVGAGNNNQSAVFVNSFEQDSHVEFYACQWNGQPQNNNHYQGKAVHVYGYDQNNTFIVRHCRVDQYRGFWLQLMGNGTTTFPTIDIRYNHATNINQYRHDGVGGYYIEENVNPPFENSQFLMIQVATMSDAQGSINVSYNYIQCLDNVSYVEDVINYYQVRGTAANPAHLDDNLIEGTYGYDAATYKGFSGTGIQLEGDGRYVIALRNYLIACGNVSAAISWGRYNQINNSVIVGSGYARGTNVLACQFLSPLFIGNPFWQPENTFDNSGAGNYIHYYKNQSDPGCVSLSRLHEGIYVLTGNTATGTVENTATIPSQADENAAITEYFANVAAAGLQIGYII